MRRLSVKQTGPPLQPGSPNQTVAETMRSVINKDFPAGMSLSSAAGEVKTAVVPASKSFFIRCSRPVLDRRKDGVWDSDQSQGSNGG